MTEPAPCAALQSMASRDLDRFQAALASGESATALLGREVTLRTDLFRPPRAARPQLDLPL